MHSEHTAETTESTAVPLIERIARPSGRERRCLECGCHIRPGGLPNTAAIGGALSNRCRRCHPHRRRHAGYPAIGLLRWCGTERMHPAAAAARRPLPVLPPRTTLRERLKERRAA